MKKNKEVQNDINEMSDRVMSFEHKTNINFQVDAFFTQKIN